MAVFKYAFNFKLQSTSSKKRMEIFYVKGQNSAQRNYLTMYHKDDQQTFDILAFLSQCCTQLASFYLHTSAKLFFQSQSWDGLQ